MIKNETLSQRITRIFLEGIAKGQAKELAGKLSKETTQGPQHNPGEGGSEDQESGKTSFFIRVRKGG